MAGLSKLKTVMQILKYMPLVLEAIQEAEKLEVDGATKSQIVVAMILAATHAGEKVDNATIQTILMVVQMAVGMANGMGLFGKPPKPVVIEIPAAEAAKP